MTHDDSVAVLHQLFHRERHHGRILAIVGGAVLPLSVVSIAKPSGSDFQRGIQTATTIVIGAQTVGSIVRWVQFSKRREREAVRRFEQRQVQPLYVQRAYALLLIEKGK